MIDWIYDDNSLNPEQIRILENSPLLKAFLSPSLDTKIWSSNVIENADKIKQKVNEKQLNTAGNTLSFLAIKSQLTNSALPQEAVNGLFRTLLLIGQELKSNNMIKDLGIIFARIVKQIRDISFLNEENLKDLRNREILLDIIEDALYTGAFFIDNEGNT